MAGEARRGRSSLAGAADDVGLDRPVDGLTRFERYLPLRLYSKQNESSHPLSRARTAQSHRKLAWLTMWPAKSVALPLTVTLTRCAPRSLDGDNLQWSFKNIRDGVADRLGVKDNDPRVTWHYAQVKTKDYGIRITVETDT